MSTERNELISRIMFAFSNVDDAHALERLADWVEASYVREPRTVTTVGGLDALPVDSTVLDAKGFVYQKWVDLDEPDLPWWALVGDSRQYPARRIALPATVLHVGAQP